MFGDISAWFYQTLGGINFDPQQPGFKHAILRPLPVGDLKWARAEHQSLYGTIACDWRQKGNGLAVKVTVPVNTTADVYVPARAVEAVSEGGQPVANAAGVKFLRMDRGAAVFEVGSGKYAFFVVP